MANLQGSYIKSYARYRFSAFDTNEVRRERFKEFEIIGEGVDAAAQQADAAANAALLEVDLGLVSEADVTLVSVRHEYGNNAFNPLSIGDVYSEALLTLTNSVVGKSAITLTFPAPADNIVSGSNVIITNANINTLLNNFKEANADQTAFLSDGDSVLNEAANVVVTGNRVRKVSSGTSF